MGRHSVNVGRWRLRWVYGKAVLWSVRVQTWGVPAARAGCGASVVKPFVPSRECVRQSFLKSAHADALHSLEKLPFGLDARGDDDLGLLKLADGRRADIAHASGDRADQILRTVINR